MRIETLANSLPTVPLVDKDLHLEMPGRCQSQRRGPQISPYLRENRVVAPIIQALRDLPPP